ncbi:hypothetical protein cypCar_00006897 [Cyprinus carpio]|nr:hypothetical protein cypCar_00006897 [Cyprinus carpio]
MSSACLVEWDGVNCWPAVSVGERVSVSCPPPFLKSHGNINSNTIIIIPTLFAKVAIKVQCYFINVKPVFLILTSLELITRTCTSEGWSRLSVSYYDACFQDNSTEQEETGHRSVIVLSEVKSVIFAPPVLPNVKLICYQTGAPSVTVIIWTFFKHKYDNHGCWDDLDSGYWWIIKIPILLSVFVNFLVFVNISRIIVVKTKTPELNGGDRQLYRRLAKSTLLLIPLFGVHYIVFALFPEHVGLEARLFFELVLGSFQGFIVALLYCFLNCEVQNEIRKEIGKYKFRTDNNTFQMATQDFTA